MGDTDGFAGNGSALPACPTLLLVDEGADDEGQFGRCETAFEPGKRLPPGPLAVV